MAVGQRAKTQGRMFIDTLFNLISGMGTAKDKQTSMQFAQIDLDRTQLEAMYRSDWVARKVIDIPAQDATRAWRQWQADNKQIEALEEEEQRLLLQVKTRKAMILKRLFGGAALVLGVNQGQSYDELKPDQVQKGDLKFVHVVHRWELSAAAGYNGAPGGLEDDLNSPYFGQPRMYQRIIQGGTMAPVYIHPSRIVRFVGNEFPDAAQAWANEGWGESVLQSVYDAVVASGSVTAGIASLVNEAKIDIIKIPELTKKVTTKEYRDRILARFSLSNVSKSMNNALLIDALEDWSRAEINFGGFPDLIKVYMTLAAGAADIPATRMLGQSPTGLHSTGDHDTRNYYDRIAADQSNVITPAMVIADEVLIRSALGADDPNIHYLWNPLWQMDDVQRATIALQKAQAFQIDVSAGIMSPLVLKEGRENQLIEDGTYPGLESAIADEGGAFDPLAREDQQNQMQAQLNAAKARLLGAPKAPAAGGASATVTAGSVRGENDNAVADAEPRSLYVYRKLQNADAFISWAKDQGFKTTLPADEMHVTIMYSKEPLDWMKLDGDAYGQDENGILRVPPGGVRLCEVFDGGACVLLFTSSNLSYRHSQMRREGASYDYEDFQPHVTITYQRGEVDPALIEPYRGELVFGPEIFEEIRGSYTPGEETQV